MSSPRPERRGRVAALGKSFMLDRSPFRFRGVRCLRCASPAMRCGDGHRTVALDVAGVAAAGYTVVSVPHLPEAVVERAESNGLRFLLEPDDLELSRIVGASRRERLQLVREQTMALRRSVRSWSQSPALLGVVVSRPMHAHGRGHTDRLVGRAADALGGALHSEQPGLLAVWRDRWPLEQECPPEFDCLLVDFEVPDANRLEPAIMAAHGWLGDRPLVLGEVGLTGVGSHSEPDAQLVIDAALRCGAAGTLGSRLPPPDTREERAAINRRTVRDLDVNWPSITVVVSAHNASRTLEECLSHCERLEYPQLEVIVVDDGSTDNTAEIARAHPRARLITLPRSGLSVARNAGYSAARGELVAYIDADAYPSAEWPWYLAFAATGEQVGGAGGPNLPPPGEPPPAQIVARTPGGPLPALRSPDRASHLPGCNMAFRREVLVDLGGFDPDLPSAEDVDFQLRLATRGLELGYHPAAFVWHHRRPGVRTYLRQQYSYGRGQTLLALRNPEYFHRHRLHKLLRALGRRTRPDWPAVLQVSYTSLRWRERAGLDLAHQWGVPLAIAAIGTAPLGLVRRTLVTPAAAAATSLVGLFCVDTALALGDLKRSPSRRRMAAQIAALQLLRPPAFVWGTFTQTVRLKLAQARAHPRSR